MGRARGVGDETLFSGVDLIEMGCHLLGTPQTVAHGYDLIDESSPVI